jgi:hypothetical protein
MNMGYVNATQLEISEYFVNQGVIQRVMLDGNTLLMTKAVNPDSVYNNAGIVGSSGDDAQTINSAVFNPYFRAKMDRIASGNVTPEAYEFYRNYIAQKQQLAMQEMWNRNMASQQQAYPGPGMWQPGQTMTEGAYRMPFMQGVSNQS